VSEIENISHRRQFLEHAVGVTAAVVIPPVAAGVHSIRTRSQTMIHELSDFSPQTDFASFVRGRGPLRVAFEEDSWTFDYLRAGRTSDDLLFFFPSALQLSSRRVPHFHRWSWADRLGDAEVALISDPTLRLDDSMIGGWFQGRHDDWVLLRVLRHVQLLTKALGTRRIIFTGSSLGGFAAIQAATILSAPDSPLKNVAIGFLAEIPQTSLRLYSVRSVMNTLARSCYGLEGLNNVPLVFDERLDVVATMQAKTTVPRGVVVSKASDVHHHGVHTAHLEQGLVRLGGRSQIDIQIIPSDIDPSGHSPLPLDKFLHQLERVRAWVPLPR